MKNYFVPFITQICLAYGEPEGIIKLAGKRLTGESKIAFDDVFEEN